MRNEDNRSFFGLEAISYKNIMVLSDLIQARFRRKWTADTYLTVSHLDQFRPQYFGLSDKLVPIMVLVLEEVGLVAVREDSTLWKIFGEKVVEPHHRILGFAEPATTRMAVQPVYSDNATKSALQDQRATG